MWLWGSPHGRTVLSLQGAGQHGSQLQQHNLQLSAGPSLVFWGGFCKAPSIQGDQNLSPVSAGPTALFSTSLWF